MLPSSNIYKYQTCQIRWRQPQKSTFDSLLFYEQAVNMTILMVFSTLEFVQANRMETMVDVMVKLLNYYSTNKNTMVRYNTNNIIIVIHSDTSYIYNPKSRIMARGHFFTDKPKLGQPLINNGALYVIATIVWYVMLPAFKVEVAALFINTKGSNILQNITK